ncbi:MAG: phage tail protein [Caldilineaceae bacterium]|nr:phage tail protein [Caldilineaceae bacterium]
MANEILLDPLHVFRFEVEFTEVPLGGGAGSAIPLCRGAFSECTGLEATMEPKVIKEGGRNYGAAQRSGQVTFATVILKRGITDARHLWQWFELVNRQGAYAYRLNVTIRLMDGAGKPRLTWTLLNTLPVKFKSPDLNATAGEVGIEELHLAHEGLTLERA